ncbi:MAG: Ribosomal small subunit methyltransferase [Planctomycetota bacterium]|jgi:16S rRNA (adenine1518-N6/adenine1519-N6)-dimethyltransferase
MKDVQRQTRTHLLDLFRQHGLNPRGDLGQNFLIDVNLIEFVVRHGELSRRDVVLEVGTGTGGMTAFMVREAGHVISVDIDRNMSALAGAAVAGHSNVTLVNEDILKNKNTLSPAVTALLCQQLVAIPNSRLKLVANLPYSVGTPVISNLVASDLPWERMVCTIQWELAEKMCAEAGGSGYGALSVWIQSQASVRILRRLGPKVFWPRPKVDSAIVSIWRDPEGGSRISNRRFFQDFLRRLFSQRRKHLRGVIAGMYRRQLEKPQVDSLLEGLGMRGDERAELLEPAALIRISNGLCELVDVNNVDASESESETD